MVDAYQTKLLCPLCKGSGEWFSKPCTYCDTSGYIFSGTVEGAEQIADLTDKVDDCLDKLDDIIEKLNE